ncbi:BamA/OMP85 family outer membrane protein [Halanaerobacter jeridensis]|uniref:Outer membrane protein insertion porin family n=1 Tax=Halanaerobacter jeridensis TaxID=706427 RepID=A0A938XS07_9FIRM|nr:BamA/TamA family outer membrane protein [Halanaerobacter jeridensis]MBM7555191.1 outer membrane protein insertion porin family [Halanaerobacter jeridensis]
MLKKVAVITFLLTIVVFNTSVFAADGLSGNKITDIKVEGNQKVSEQEILMEVETQVGDKIDNDKLKKDLRSIYDLGYFLDIKINFRNYKDGVQLIFKVMENPVLEKVVIEGNKEVTTKKLKKLLGVKSGEILNVNTLKNGIKEINNYYQNQGFPLGRVVDRRIKNGNQLYLEVNEGKINKIKIKGNKETKEYVIRRELSLQEGQVLNMNKLQRDIRDLYRLGFFKGIKPQFKRVENNPQAVNVILEVTEKKTGSLQFGISHSPDAGMMGTINVSKDNLFGTGQKVNVKLESGEERDYYELGYSNPWMSKYFDVKTSFKFNLYNKTEEDLNNDEIREKGGNVTIGRQLTYNTNSYFTVDISKIKDEDESDWRDNRTLRLSTIRDTTTAPISPRYGSKQSLTLEKAGWIGGDDDYSKYNLELKKYFPSLEKNSWALRLKVAGSNGDLPDDKRYYLGGTNGIRGYGSSYYDEDAQSYDPTQAGFIGNSMLLGSVEYRIPIVEAVRGVVFGDVGRTYQGNSLDLDIGDFNYSYGVGLRFKTPVGELGLDYGYAPDAKRNSKDDFSLVLGSKF